MRLILLDAHPLARPVPIPWTQAYIAYLIGRRTLEKWANSGLELGDVFYGVMIYGFAGMPVAVGIAIFGSPILG
jgi:hypothetical protein